MKRYSDSIPFVPLPDTPASPGPLPEASMTEPFEIGEALDDPTRVEQAVMSLLAQMNIAVIPGDGAASRSGGGLRLDEAEVRASIALAEQDLEAGAGRGALPFTFADLHRAVSGLLPQLSPDALAAAYSRAYAARSDDLVAKAMLGQQIVPETPLTRAHIWLLLMDGFAGPAGSQARWGTADRELPDLPSPVPQWSTAEWKEVIMRIALVPSAAAAGRRWTPRDRAGAQGRTAGRPLSAPEAHSRRPLSHASQATRSSHRRRERWPGNLITWNLRDDSVLLELGTVTSPVGQPVRVGANGVSAFTYQPGADATGGQGALMDEWSDIDATMSASDVVSNAYGVPQSLSNLVLGNIMVRTRVRSRWRADDVLDLFVYNQYNVGFQTPVGDAFRMGYNGFTGRLAWRSSDGTFRGTVAAGATGVQLITGSTTCAAAPTTSEGYQQLYVIAEAVTELGVTHAPRHYEWADRNNNRVPLANGKSPRTWQEELPDGGYLALAFFPATEPLFRQGRWDKCQVNIPAGEEQRGHGAKDFLPLNDAQWTTALGKYLIGVKTNGAFRYYDVTSESVAGQSSWWFVQGQRRRLGP